ncbi:MAG: hypothetical protein ABI649_10705 [Gaiellaceae bacterium]
MTEFFPGSATEQGNPKALRVSRYFGDEHHEAEVRFSVWSDSERSRLHVDAAASLEETEAARLARFLAQAPSFDEQPTQSFEVQSVPQRSSGLPSPTLRLAADEFLDGAERREVLNRSGRPYKPSAIRGYRSDLERYVLPELGGARLGDLAPHDFQALADRLVGAGLSASKVRNVLTAVRPLYRRARARGLVAANPLEGLELPAVTGRRERIASPGEAAQLLAALPADLRPLYGTAFYAGLRRGELRGLRWEDVDMAGGRIHVCRGWDDHEGERPTATGTCSTDTRPRRRRC